MENRRTTFLALAAVILTLGALWYIHRPEIPREATLADVQAEAVRGGYRLMTTEALAKLYPPHPAKVLLVDTRQDWEYRSGHIQGAVNFPLEPHRLVPVAVPEPPGGLAGARPGPVGGVLLSGPGLSPERLGGPGGRQSGL